MQKTLTAALAAAFFSFSIAAQTPAPAQPVTEAESRATLSRAVVALDEARSAFALARTAAAKTTAAKKLDAAAGELAAAATKYKLVAVTAIADAATAVETAKAETATATGKAAAAETQLAAARGELDALKTAAQKPTPPPTASGTVATNAPTEVPIPKLLPATAKQLAAGEAILNGALGGDAHKRDNLRTAAFRARTFVYLSKLPGVNLSQQPSEDELKRGESAVLAELGANQFDIVTLRRCVAADISRLPSNMDWGKVLKKPGALSWDTAKKVVAKNSNRFLVTSSVPGTGMSVGAAPADILKP